MKRRDLNVSKISAVGIPAKSSCRASRISGGKEVDSMGKSASSVMGPTGASVVPLTISMRPSPGISPSSRSDSSMSAPVRGVSVSRIKFV